MGPQWAETDPQSLSKIQIRTTTPENTLDIVTCIRASPPFWARASSTALEKEELPNGIRAIAKCRQVPRNWCASSIFQNRPILIRLPDVYPIDSGYPQE